MILGFVLGLLGCTHVIPIPQPCDAGIMVNDVCIAQNDTVEFRDTAERRTSTGPEPSVEVEDQGDDTADVAEPDAGPTLDPEEWSCTPGALASVPLGAECSAHCECESELCYDEAYMGPFRFCTMAPPAGGCESLNTPQTSYTSLVLNQQALASLELTMTWLCVPECASMADCEPLSEAYTQCGNPKKSGTYWGNVDTGDYVTLSLGDTCQVGNMVDQLP